MRIFLFWFCLVLATPGVANDQVFETLLEQHWQYVMREKVFFRMDMDAWRFSGPLADMTPAGEQRRQAFNANILNRLQQIDVGELGRDNQISYQVFKYERETEREAYRQPGIHYQIDNRSGWHSFFANAPANMSFLTVADYQAYLVSLADFPRFNREHIELLENAVASRHTQFCESMAGFEHSIAAQIVESADQSTFFRPLTNMPQSIPRATRLSLQAQAAELISTQVVPAYHELLDFYLRVYQPQCRQREGISSRPGGEAYYRYLVRYFTTTDMSPLEIHKLGEREVARIQEEMNRAISETDFEGSFAEFLLFLREDPQFYVSEGEDLLEKASRIAKRMDGQLPRLFATLPRLPYDIQEIPASNAEKTTAAFYAPAPGDGRTPGSYYVNTSLLPSRPLYTMEALTFHEAVPGHHLQMSLALENDMPEFRRHLYYSAFGEGWALYAESLGLEAGFYRDPYSNFGRLTYEMWRACRLVVDTGLHAFGWSRQQAIDYMATHTALSIHEVTAEIDRYITWPAQALSYKIGELRIRALREQAREIQGEDFDLRVFHDKVLENGSLPIAVLEQLVQHWLTQPQ